MNNNTSRNREELTSGLTVTRVGMLVNFALFVIKITAGWFGRSQALIADGVHSLSDLLSDVVVLLGLKWGRKEEDESHPFGHARIETIAGMFIGLVLIGTAVGLAYSSISTISDRVESSPGLTAIIAALISVGLKEGLYWYTVKVGRRIRSLAVIANAWHHRSDALSSIAVLVGVTAAYLSPAWAMADAYAALVVTFFVVKIGAGLIWSAAEEVIDTAPDQAAMDQVKETALRVPGVQQTHDIRARLS
ncbi:MAG: cation transporter, partial [candidate division Zixibacteria bacterium]|nr:cation transporter [candidate division Zixibacteria bacterium]